jgi:hypothetical protein
MHQKVAAAHFHGAIPGGLADHEIERLKSLTNLQKRAPSRFFEKFSSSVLPETFPVSR